MRIGFWAWLGFALPFATGDAMFSGKDKSLIWPMFLVQAGHHLVGLLVMGVIPGAWMQQCRDKWCNSGTIKGREEQQDLFTHS